MEVKPFYNSWRDFDQYREIERFKNIVQLLNMTEGQQLRFNSHSDFITRKDEDNAQN